MEIIIYSDAHFTTAAIYVYLQWNLSKFGKLNYYPSEN